ncbi:MAG: hypothetical protein Q6K81_00560 [Gloeomargarita sp. DG02_5_bins_242]
MKYLAVTFMEQWTPVLLVMGLIILLLGLLPWVLTDWVVLSRR